MIPLHDDNPTERTPFVTMFIIALCVVVFLYQASLSPEPSEAFAFRYGAIPSVVFGLASLPD